MTTAHFPPWNRDESSRVGNYVESVPDKLEPDYGLLAAKKAAGATDEQTFGDGAPAWALRFEAGSFERAFAFIFQEAFELLVQRQRKYGSANIEQQGLYGVFTRIRDDKMSRLSQVMNGQVVNGRAILDITDLESGEQADTFEDALIDIANYSLIMLALYRGQWGQPLEGEE